MNMFMAIIGNSYKAVKEENASKAPEFMLSDYLRMNFSRIADKLSMRKDRFLDFKSILESEKFNDEHEITFVEWRKALRVSKYLNQQLNKIIFFILRVKDTRKQRLSQFLTNTTLMVMVS